MRLNAKFGELLREKRDAAGLSQQRLADDAGVARSTIVKIEGGVEGVRLFVLYRLAKALGLHPRELLPDPAHLNPPADEAALRRSATGATRDILLETLANKGKST